MRTGHRKRQYIASLRKALLLNCDAVLYTVATAEERSLDYHLANFLLEEAEWTLDDFLTAVRGRKSRG